LNSHFGNDRISSDYRWQSGSRALLCAAYVAVYGGLCLSHY
jgi:hypothetical protein